MHAEAEVRLGHRKPGLGGMASGTRVEEGGDSSGRDASEDPRAGHGRRRWRAGLGVGTAVGLHAEVASSHLYGDAGRPCGRARRLALGTTRV